MTKKDQRTGDTFEDETTTQATGEEEAIPMPAGTKLPDEPAQNPQGPTMR
ncbi:MAG TPA: hypothetical protein VFM93_09690 [Candidatus Limnocylindria bacterium]|nr:hypothetical protein [Candidatus Limnocylindria bacterium]